MGNYTDRIDVSANADTVFAYLSDVSNLPHYFSRMRDAEPGQGEEVHTTATTPSGDEVSADAWFRTDQQRQRIEWGSEGTSDYHGWLEVHSMDGSGSQVEVSVHTERVPDGNSEVASGLGETLRQLKSQVEAQSA